MFQNLQQLGWQTQQFSMLLFLLLQVLISPVFANSCGVKESSVKANMITLQTMVETYAFDWNGQFPSSLNVLVKEAKQKKYWRDFKNPMNTQSGLGKSLIDLKLLHGFNKTSLCQIQLLGIPVRFDEIPCSTRISQSEYEGVVVYDVRRDSEKVSGYFIYGLDKAGQLIEVGRQVVYLSNS